MLCFHGFRLVAVVVSVCALIGCAKPKHAAPTSTPQTTPPPSSTAAAQPALQMPAYSPMRPFPYDQRIPPTTSQRVFEGRAPETQEELEQAVAADPNSNMAKAQEFYTNEAGQKMWRYTEVTPVTPTMELEMLSLGLSKDAHYQGKLGFRNRSPFNIVDLQVTLILPGKPTVMIPPARNAFQKIPPGQGTFYKLDGYLTGSGTIRGTVPVRIEAQIDGPPGLMIFETGTGDISVNR
jgi:hypothetical protein